jgi:uncharacterized protein YycO
MKRIPSLPVYFLFILLSGFLASCSPNLKKVKEGDILFQTSPSDQSKAIQLATHSTWSHCGIVLADSTGKLFVLEATEPVKETPLKQWVSEGEGKHFADMRMKNANSVLTKGILEKMEKIGDSYLGKHYDSNFNWSDDEMYCSELVYKVYYRTTGIQLAPLKQLKDFDLTSDEVKQKLQERYKGKIPLNEQVISPEQLFESTWLVKVFQQ